MRKFLRLIHKPLKIEPIRSMTDLEDTVERLGFLPMFGSSIKGFSVYENTPRFRGTEEDGPWEWKGPIIRNGRVAYGKFFNRKAGFVSLEWLPDFLNYRRTLRLAPNVDAGAMDDIVWQTIQVENNVTIKDLRRLLGLDTRRLRAEDMVVTSEIQGKINLDTNLTRLMMEGRVCISDFVYNIDKHGNPYGWGIAKYSTPELLYGQSIKADCPPEESLVKIYAHLAKLIPTADSFQLAKIIG